MKEGACAATAIIMALRMAAAALPVVWGAAAIPPVIGQAAPQISAGAACTVIGGKVRDSASCSYVYVYVYQRRGARGAGVRGRMGRPAPRETARLLPVVAGRLPLCGALQGTSIHAYVSISC